MSAFFSKTRFESGTGWPSFWQPVAKENVTVRQDNSLACNGKKCFVVVAMPISDTFSTMVPPNLYRIPVDAAGKAGQPVDIWIDQPVKGPDGMRAANDKLPVAENGSGKISVITVNGDRASLTVIKEGLKTPTAVEPDADTIWVAERGTGKAVSIPMPK